MRSVQARTTKGSGRDEKSWLPRLDGPLRVRTKVRTAACGYAHSAILCVDGSLYTFGTGMHGRLGLGDTDDRRVPCLVKIQSDTNLENKVVAFTSVACGAAHTLAAAVIRNSLDDGDTKDSNFQNKSDDSDLESDSFCHRLFAFGCGLRFRLGTGDERNRCTPTAIHTLVPVPSSVSPLLPRPSLDRVMMVLWIFQ